MIPAAVKDALTNNCASYIRPFLWYSGENKELLAREIRAIAQSGAKEFVFEKNRLQRRLNKGFLTIKIKRRIYV